MLGLGDMSKNVYLCILGADLRCTVYILVLCIWIKQIKSMYACKHVQKK